MVLIQGGEALGLQPVSNWILGVGSFALLIWIPYQLYSASRAMVPQPRYQGGQAGGSGGDEVPDAEDEMRERRQRRRDRDRRRGRR
jgi:hypothetical protein